MFWQSRALSKRNATSAPGVHVNLPLGLAKINSFLPTATHSCCFLANHGKWPTGRKNVRLRLRSERARRRRLGRLAARSPSRSPHRPMPLARNSEQSPWSRLWLRRRPSRHDCARALPRSLSLPYALLSPYELLTACEGPPRRNRAAHPSLATSLPPIRQVRSRSERPCTVGPSRRAGLAAHRGRSVSTGFAARV